MRGEVESFIDWSYRLFEGLEPEERESFLRGVSTLMGSPILARALAMVEADALRKVRNYQGQGPGDIQSELEVLSGLNAIRKRFQHLGKLAAALKKEDALRG